MVVCAALVDPSRPGGAAAGRLRRWLRPDLLVAAGSPSASRSSASLRPLRAALAGDLDPDRRLLSGIEAASHAASSLSRVTSTSGSGDSSCGRPCAGCRVRAMGCAPRPCPSPGPAPASREISSTCSRALRGARWSLLKNPEHLNEEQAASLRRLRRHGGAVWRASSTGSARRLSEAGSSPSSPCQRSSARTAPASSPRRARSLSSC